jgi:hypothetical protein
MPSRIGWIAYLLCLSCLAGCLPYCAGPSLSYTPAVEFAAPASEVHAFRVDITKEKVDLDVFSKECLSEIPAQNTDEVPAQLRPGVTSGLVVFGVAVNYVTCTSHSLALRLYRPGYDLVEVASWQLNNRVTWHAAAHLAAQEEAVDSLFPLDRGDKSMGQESHRLANGSASPAHRQALLFGASEYDRLEHLVESKDQLARLSRKAAALRDLAAR